MKADKEEKIEAGGKSETACTSALHPQRPRRNVMHKNAEYHNGLLWTEEKDLKKALYASLQDSKRSRFSESEGDISEPINMAKIENIKKRKNDIFRNGLFSEENSNSNPKRAKVHAQRKFAQGSNPSSPSVTPVKFRSAVPPAMDLLPVKRPKTEDFLTFLCLRGTSILPPSLDYFNVASKHDVNCDSRCQSPMNGDSAERLRPHSKLPVAKGAMKARVKSQAIKSLKPRQPTKKPFPDGDFTSTSDSSLFDTDDEIYKKTEKTKPAMVDMAKKKLMEIEMMNESGLRPVQDCSTSLMDSLPETSKMTASVQALKQKYRQQRLAKQKEALVKAKKSDLSASSVKYESLTVDKIENAAETNSETPIKVPHSKSGQQKKPKAEPAVAKETSSKAKDSGRQKKSCETRLNQSSHKAKLENITLPATKVAVADSNKPITRHAAAMLLKAVKDEEKKPPTTVKKPLHTSAKIAKFEKKQPKVQEEHPLTACKMDKNLPLLASEHSYVKRLPTSPKEIKPKLSNPQVAAGKSKLPSDFSSDDDEPLVKKQRISAAKSHRKPKSANVEKTKPGSTMVARKPINSNAKSLAKSLRSCKEPVVCAATEEDVPKTAAGRPSRKTKEAATVYLELLGQKLYSHDDDFDFPLRKKKTPPKTNVKKIPATGSVKPKNLPEAQFNHGNLSLLPSKQKPRINITVGALDTSTSSNSSSCSHSSSSSSTSSSSSPTANSKECSPSKPTMGKKKWQRTSSPNVSLSLSTPLERIDTVKTREYMKKLSEAQFKLAKAQGKKTASLKDGPLKDCCPVIKESRVYSVKHGYNRNSRNPVNIPVKATVPQIDKIGPSREKLCPKETKTKSSSRSHQEVKKVPASTVPQTSDKKSNAKSSLKTKVQRLDSPMSTKETPARIPAANKSVHSKKKTPLKSPEKQVLRNTRLSMMPAQCTRENKMKVKKEKPAVFRGRQQPSSSGSSSSSSSSSTSSSSFCAPIPIKRGPGRVPAKHALRKCPTSSSDSGSESSDDYPSKPETTTISVRQNVTSTSVAVQVNLLNDISDLDDDFFEPGFFDGDIEGLFAMDRVVTPTLCKGSSPNRWSMRSSWDPDSSSSPFKMGRSADSTPTKKASLTPERMECTTPSLADKANLKTPLKTLSKSMTSSSSSSSPLNLKPSSSSMRCSKPDSSDEESSDSHLSFLASSGVKDAPVFYPSAEEFQDPLLYIEKIRPIAERFGVCKIIPPNTFKPECKVNDEMRFIAHNQYVHKVLHRWGPNVQKLAVIRKHLEAQGVEYDHPPLIGGMELDLPRLFETVQQYCGLKEVIEKQKWQKVADSMKIAKSAQDRVTKLYDAYCKYLLPYDTLSKEEKLKLEQQVCSEKQRKKGRFADVDECVMKGRSMSLSGFYRIARNTMAMWFKSEPKPIEVEQEYWRIVTRRQHHTCVHAGNIDSSTYGYGFSCNKSSTFARHPWNLKVLTNNAGSILRCMGPVMGITIPTLHVGMLFTTGCWYRDPHCLPWIEYLHTGASKIWYGIPASQSCKFRDAMNRIVPDFCASSPIWLPSDTAMVPPNSLVENGVSLCRLVQNSGQFVVVFPRAFTSTICCGYTISESVYFAGADWLEIAPVAFKEIADSCEPAVFSLQRLLVSVANDCRTSVEVLKQILPLIKEIRDNELRLRKQLYGLGLKQSEHITSFESKDTKKRWGKSPNEEHECEICRANCFISLVVNTSDRVVYCLHHALEHLQKKKKEVKFCKLLYKYDQAELNELVQKASDQIQAHNTKKKLARKPSKKSP